MENEQKEQFQPESEQKVKISAEQQPKAEIDAEISPEIQPEPQTGVSNEGETTPKADLSQENLPEIVPDPQPKKEISAASSKSKPKAERKPATIEPKYPESPSRLTITVNFSGDEPEHLTKIIDARIKHGMTRDRAHFIRQCVDFSINSTFVFGKMKFSIPENTPKLFLKDAYFNNKKSE